MTREFDDATQPPVSEAVHVVTMPTNVDDARAMALIGMAWLRDNAPDELKEQSKSVVIAPPEYHYEAMGCGLEDRGIHDRYEAMRHGWDCAIERVFEQITDEPLYTAPPDLAARVKELDAEIAGYKEAQASHNALVRQIDEIISGKDGMAKQASLCDLVGPIHDLAVKVVTQAEQIKQMEIEADPEALSISYLQGKSSASETIRKQAEQIRAAREAITANHEWHKNYDEHDGYGESELCEINTKALAALGAQQPEPPAYTYAWDSTYSGVVYLPDIDQYLVVLDKNRTAATFDPHTNAWTPCSDAVTARIFAAIDAEQRIADLDFPEFGHKDQTNDANNQPANDGWIEWKGGDCPVEEGTIVKVKFENSEPSNGALPAEEWDWSHGDVDLYNIIAYRVAQEGGEA